MLLKFAVKIVMFFNYKWPNIRWVLRKISLQTHQLFPSTEIFSKRRKIYTWFEGKPECRSTRSADSYIIPVPTSLARSLSPWRQVCVLIRVHSSKHYNRYWIVCTVAWLTILKYSMCLSFYIFLYIYFYIIYIYKILYTYSKFIWVNPYPIR